MFSEISPPDFVSEVMSKLSANGHEAYLVGGCVRDSLLAQAPSDWDICTSALPEEVMDLFARHVEIGTRHGTIRVLPGTESYYVDVTTFRTETKYSDHRRPDSVRFVPTLSEDLARRDFTVNALAWGPSVGIVDLFGGRSDIELGVIRCVGNPLERFSEDALRMLRAIRFCSKLGFMLAPEVVHAIRQLKSDLKHVSRERIYSELSKTLSGKKPSCSGLWWDTGLAEILFKSIALSNNSKNAFKSYEAFGTESIASSADSGRSIGSLAGSVEAVTSFTEAREAKPCNRLSKDNSSIAALNLRNAAPSDESFLWALFWKACSTSDQVDIIKKWMKDYRFSNRLSSEIMSLLLLLYTPLTLSSRNMRKAVSENGIARVRAAMRIQNIVNDNLKPPGIVISMPVNLPDGTALKKMLPEGLSLSGKEFGAALSCIHMAIFEKPELIDDDAVRILTKHILEIRGST